MFEELLVGVDDESCTVVLDVTYYSLIQ